MPRITLLILTLLPALFIAVGCKRMTSTQGAVVESSPHAVQISAPGIDAAEPVMAAAPDGSFYIAWINHEAKQADVMLAQFTGDGEMRGSPVRVNRQPGIATAWRGDQPSLAVAADGSVYVVWTARIES